MLSILSCVGWQPVYLLWRNVYIDLPILDWVVCFFDIEMYELLVILEINPLSVASFAVVFHLVYCFLCCAKDFKFH